MHPINIMIAVYFFLMLVYLGVMAFRISKDTRRFFLLGWETPKIIGAVLLRIVIWLAAGVVLFILLGAALFLLTYIVSPPRLPLEDRPAAAALENAAKIFTGNTLRLKG